MTKIFGRVKADTLAYYQLRKLISSRICHSPWVWWYPTFRRIVAPSSSSTSSPWKWIQYDPSKRQKLHTRRPSVTCQRTWVFRSTAVRTSDVALSVPSTKRHDKFCSIDKLCLQTKWHYCFSWLASFLAKLYPYLHILTILGAFAYLRKKKKPITLVTSVHLSVSISASPTGRISVKFDIGDFHEICRSNPNLVKIGHFTWRPN